jgi:ferredoxin
MKIEIDRLLCQASGTCVQLVPRVFAIAENGEYACVRNDWTNDEAQLIEQINEAEESCPTGAITVAP